MFVEGGCRRGSGGKTNVELPVATMLKFIHRVAAAPRQEVVQCKSYVISFAFNWKIISCLTITFNFRLLFLIV